MKKLILIAIMISLTACTNIQTKPCSQEQENQIKKEESVKFEYGDVDVFRIQEIDGCEYILINGNRNHEPAFTHKGNCKYCLERNQLQMDRNIINENINDE